MFIGEKLPTTAIVMRKRFVKHSHYKKEGHHGTWGLMTWFKKKQASLGVGYVLVYACMHSLERKGNRVLPFKYVCITCMRCHDGVSINLRRGFRRHAMTMTKQH